MPDSKTSVREVLEAIGATPGALDERDAAALLDIHLGLVQACNHTDELADLQRVRDGALKALKTTFQQRTESTVVRSHAEPLVDALAPLQRLIEKLEKAQPPKKPSTVAPTGVPAKAEPVKPKSDIPDNLPPVQKGIREGLRDGNLKDRLKNDPGFRKDATEWVQQANPDDVQQRNDLVAMLKNLEGGDTALRTQVFEKAFKTKVQSQTRLYIPIMVPKTNPPQQKIGRDGKPMFREEFKDNAPLDPAAMDAMADVMSQMPPAHMPKKWFLLGQDADDNTRGSYDDNSDGADLAFSLKDSKNGFKQEYAGNCLPGDPLEKAKAFDLLIRHECGHKAAKESGSEALTNTADGGSWREHGTAEQLLGELGSTVSDFVRAVQAGGDKPAELAIRKAVANPENGFDAGAIADALGVDPARVPADHLLLQVLQQGALKKFLCGSSPVSVGGRMYVVGGPGEGSWHSFDKAAWDKRLSLYQYAAPNEWFAEFYAAANNGEPSVRKEAKSRFPGAWSWLKSHDCLIHGD